MLKGRLGPALAAIYPLSLVLGLIPVPVLVIAIRLGVAVAAAPGLLRLGAMTRSHRRWFLVIALYLAAVAISAVFAIDRGRAMADLQRQAFMVAIGLALSLALVEERARSAFMLGMAGMAMAVAVVVLPLYGRFAGLPLIGPAAETFKAYAGEAEVPLNALSFAGLLAMTLALPRLRSWTPLLAMTLIAVGAAVVISGSRTTLVSALVAPPLTTVVLLMAAKRRVPSWIPYAAVGTAVAWAAFTFSDQIGRVVVSPALSELTTGRSTLWYAAWGKFLERPLTGWGGGSFGIELARFLPSVGSYPADELRLLGIPGGAHNALLNVLAERGLLAALAAILVVGFVLSVALRLFRARAQLSEMDRWLASLAPFVVVLIIVRSFGELPGWFAAADSLVDFLAYGAAALLVGLASTLDRVSAGDGRRATLINPSGGKRGRRNRRVAGSAA